ncbi:MAG: hypothetical protein ACJAWW_001595 [Sulfurimonas sp.]|jgi:hypothetical protein
MNVTQYTFQSPYNSSIQVGRVDPNSRKDASTQDSSPEFLKNTNSSAGNSKNFQSTQTNEVKPMVDSGNTLDIYA